MTKKASLLMALKTIVQEHQEVVGYLVRYHFDRVMQPRIASCY
jgi:hypothetical protein